MLTLIFVWYVYLFWKNFGLLHSYTVLKRINFNLYSSELVILIFYKCFIADIVESSPFDDKDPYLVYISK